MGSLSEIPEMNRDLKDIPFIVFDVETTSLHDFSGRIVEIGAVKFDLPGTVYEEFSSLINPGIPIPEKVIGIHGITDEMVKNERGAREVLEEFLEFIGNSTTLMCAHNASFDIGFVSNELARCGLPIPAHRVLDTVSLSRTLFPEAGSHNLENLVNFLGISTVVTHRALDDVLQERELFLRCVEKGTLKNEQDLYDHARVMPFESSVDFSVECPPGFE